MVVPAALVFRVREERVLKEIEIASDLGEGDRVDLVGEVFVDRGHELPAVVPCRKVGEIFPDQTFCRVTFPLQELLNYLSCLLFAQSPSYLGLVQLYNPQPIVPAVEVAFVHLKHLVA